MTEKLIANARAEHAAHGRSLRFKGLCLLIGLVPERRKR